MQFILWYLAKIMYDKNLADAITPVSPYKVKKIEKMNVLIKEKINISTFQQKLLFEYKCKSRQWRKH